jgi:hypothetical protein
MNKNFCSCSFYSNLHCAFKARGRKKLLPAFLFALPHRSPKCYLLTLGFSWAPAFPGTLRAEEPYSTLPSCKLIAHAALGSCLG